MIKGACKQMIVVRTADSRFFDEAYFVLRRDAKEHSHDHNALLTEANRLINEHTKEERQKHRLPPLQWILFAVGILCGAIAASLVCCLFL